mmetsp:Transcript_16370/g.52208  ORF Transcript_16370/g.52208 Transcript_16370/m.52208 type:complete len:273 (-) Transcript_16370:487-1305(-)
MATAPRREPLIAPARVGKLRQHESLACPTRLCATGVVDDPVDSLGGMVVERLGMVLPSRSLLACMPFELKARQSALHAVKRRALRLAGPARKPGIDSSVALVALIALCTSTQDWPQEAEGVAARGSAPASIEARAFHNATLMKRGALFVFVGSYAGSGPEAAVTLAVAQRGAFSLHALNRAFEAMNHEAQKVVVVHLIGIVKLPKALHDRMELCLGHWQTEHAHGLSKLATRDGAGPVQVEGHERRSIVAPFGGHLLESVREARPELVELKF